MCRACSRCCRHKLIQVNPYEIARLARRLGKSWGETREEFTYQGRGTVLRQKDDGSCIFLDRLGCSVHEDRPLVCRLYPLGRKSKADGTEEWVHLSPHPESEGQYSEDGTIAAFIAAQGALPYMKAADGYAQWVRDATIAADRISASAGADDVADELVDMDVAIAAYCALTATPEPTDIEERRHLHMKILYEQLQAFTGGSNERTQNA